MPPKKKVKEEKETKDEDVENKEEEKEEKPKDAKDDAVMNEDDKEDDDEEESEDDEESEESDLEERGRGKRKRTSIADKAFEPEDFTMKEQQGVILTEGRGSALKDMPSVVASVKRFVDELPNAHALLFGARVGKVSKKDMMKHILDFNGYLRKVPKGQEESEMEAEDEELETLYSKRAFKLKISQVRDLCDFFNVQRVAENGKPLNKEDMIENLLDFLSQPNVDFLNPEGPPKPKGTPKKAATPRKSSESPFHLVKTHKKGKKPSDEALRQWVQAYIVCFDMDSATTKHAIRTASDKFGVDLSKSKQRIKELLTEEM
eukprot:Nitzschia sp. Nitz4//scaffold141_size107518//83035//84098//NITZ4_004292-RA/size107518-snap-gene-0.198-mRNA-1//-1//CDS//3329536336//2829//frame0